jgi:hypothetical protein
MTALPTAASAIAQSSLPTGTQWALIIGVLIALALLVMTLYELRERDDPAEAGRAVGERSRRAIGGAAGFTAMLSTGILGGLYEAGMSFGDFIELAGDIIVASPQFVGSLVVFAFSIVRMEGLINVTLGWYIGLSLIVIIGGAAIAMRANRGERADLFGVFGD